MALLEAVFENTVDSTDFLSKRIIATCVHTKDSIFCIGSDSKSKSDIFNTLFKYFKQISYKTIELNYVTYLVINSDIRIWKDFEYRTILTESQPTLSSDEIGIILQDKPPILYDTLVIYGIDMITPEILDGIVHTSKQRSYQPLSHAGIRLIMFSHHRFTYDEILVVHSNVWSKVSPEVFNLNLDAQ